MNRGTIFSIIAVIVIIVLTELSYSREDNAEDFSKKIKVSLREVGNQLLLSNGDSTSLILPVKKLGKSQYELSFQSHLLFLPDSLVRIAKRNIEKSELSQNYLVEVIQCTDKEVAYSYEINLNEEKTIIPCSNRILPLKCYTLQFQFLDQREHSNRMIFYLFVLVGFVILEFILYRFRVHKKNVEKKENYTSLGSFQFYPEQNKLIKEAQEIALSNKERELLEIFVANANQVVKREDLTKRVWEDNGVFVGRSLDTYISKLRKKLQDDAAIKITNVHGVGYKLEITL